LGWFGEYCSSYGIGYHQIRGIQYHCTNTGDNLDGQHKDERVIEGVLDSKADKTVASKYAENVDMYKYNLDYIVVGIEVAE
jgi:hypothetical protein